MADKIEDYAAVAAERELEGEFQILNRIEDDGGFQKIEEEGKTDVSGVVREINEKTEPEDNVHDTIEKIVCDGVIQKMSERIESESGDHEKTGEKIRPEVDEQSRVNDKIGPLANDQIRSSTETSGVLRSEGKVLSRYLRPPTGSCHDLCKYGIGHGFEAKQRIPLWKWIPARGGSGMGMEKVTISVEGKKKGTMSPKHSPGLRTGKPNDPVIMKKSVSLDNSLLSSEGMDAPLEQVSNQKKPDQPKSSSLPVQKDLNSQAEINESQNGSRSRKRNQGKNRTMRESVTGETNFESSSERDQKQKSDQPKSSCLPVQKGSNCQAETNESQNGSSSGKKNQGKNRTVRKSVIGETNFEPSSVSSSQKDSSKRTSTINMRDGRNHRGSPYQINLRNTKVIKPGEARDEDSREQNLHVIECTTEKEPPASTSTGVSRNLSSSNLESKERSFTHVRKVTPTSGLPPSSRKSRVPISLITPSSKKGFRRAGSRFLHNTSASLPSTKSLRQTQNRMHRVRSSSRSPSPSSSPPRPSMSRSSSTHGKRAVKSNGYTRGGQASNMVYKIRPRRGAVVVSGNNFIQPRKLSFRRGRVIELPQQQNSAPRRLKFRRPRQLGEIENGENDYRTRVTGTEDVDQSELTMTKIKSEKLFRRNQLLDVNKRSSFGLRRKEVHGNQSGITRSVAEKIILRHQMVEGKKNLQHLYNNVIEETASKLAETRKSKVKALVGAFETVISLEDSKPAAITNAC